MNISQVLAALNRGAEMIERLTPLATALGGSTAATVSGVIVSTAAVASNVLERIKEGNMVASSHDQEELKAMVARLGNMNDALNAAIEKS